MKFSSLAADPDRTAVEMWAMNNFATLEKVTADELHKVAGPGVMVVSSIGALSAADFAMLVRNGVSLVSTWSVDARRWTGVGGLVAPVVEEFGKAAERWAKEAPVASGGVGVDVLERRIDELNARLIEAQMTIQELRHGLPGGSIGGQRISGEVITEHGTEGGASCKVDPPSVVPIPARRPRAKAAVVAG